MTEPVCYHTDTRVVDSRRSNMTHILRRRRHECRACGYRFSTVEITAENLTFLEDYDLHYYINERVKKARHYARTTSAD
jgi:transcriptional regulator NrdR family protein